MKKPLHQNAFQPAEISPRKNDLIIPEELKNDPLVVESEKKKKKRRKLRNRKNYYERLEKRRVDINERMLKILERVELDRPILLKEKFEVLWNMDGASAETD